MKQQRKHQQLGTSLIEILITMLVVAVALLGAASAQILALRYQVTAQSRYQAMQGAEMIIEKMRVNNSRVTRAAAAAAPNTRYLAGTGYADSLPPAPGQLTCGGATNVCNAADAAVRDLTEWRTFLNTTLPDGRGALLAVANQPNQRRVVVMWQEKREKEQTAADNPLVDDTCPEGRNAVPGVRCLNLWVSL
jgi:type IV pilus assembly protein PilV